MLKNNCCKKNMHFVMFFLFILLMAFPFQSKAEMTHQSFTIMPILLEETHDPGESVIIYFSIINHTDQEQYYSVEVKDFIPDDQGGIKEFINDNSNPYALSQWVEVPKRFGPIKAHEKAAVLTRGHIPKDASAGGYYTAVLFTPENNPNNNSGSQINISQAAASLLFFRISGEINESLELNQFTINDSTLFSLPATFTASVENSGNVHLKASGEITVKSKLWPKIEPITVPITSSGSGMVLPERIRNFKVFFSDFNPWAIGPYSAKLQLSYSNQEKLKQDLSFWFLPTRQIISITSLLISGIIILRYLFIKYFHKIRTKTFKEWLSEQESPWKTDLRKK